MLSVFGELVELLLVPSLPVVLVPSISVLGSGYVALLVSIWEVAVAIVMRSVLALIHYIGPN